MSDALNPVSHSRANSSLGRGDRPAIASRNFRKKSAIDRINTVFDSTVMGAEKVEPRIGGAAKALYPIGDVRGFTSDLVMGMPVSRLPATNAVAAAIGLTTTANALPSAGRIFDARDQIKEARRRGDHRLAQDLTITALAQGAMASAAASMMAVRPLTWAANLSPSSAIISAQATGMKAASSLFCAFFTFFASLQIKQILDLSKAKERLSSSLGDLFKISNPQEIFNELGNKGAEDTCRKTAYQQGALWLTQLAADMRKGGAKVPELEKLSDKEKEEAVKQYFKDEPQAWERAIRKELQKRLGKEDGLQFWQECLRLTDGDLSAAFGLALKTQFANETRENEWLRVFDKETLGKLRNEGYSEEDRIALAKSAIDAKIKEKGISVCGCVIEVSSIILSMLTLGPIVAIVAAITYGLSSLYWYYVESADFENWLKTGSVGKWDKAVSMLSIGIAAISIIAMIVISHGGLPLIGLIAIAGLQTFINFDKWKKELPWLEDAAKFASFVLGLTCIIFLLIASHGVPVFVLLIAIGVQTFWVNSNVKVIRKANEEEAKSSSILKAKAILDADLEKDLSEEESAKTLQKIISCYERFSKKEQDLVTKSLRGRVEKLGDSQTLQVLKETFDKILVARQAVADEFIRSLSTPSIRKAKFEALSNGINDPNITEDKIKELVNSLDLKERREVQYLIELQSQTNQTYINKVKTALNLYKPRFA